MTKINDIDILSIHSNKINWSLKDESVKLYYKLKVHANGEVPVEIIRERRPNEPEEIMRYREKIYASKTSHPINKVITSLSKIYRNPDWKIDYSESEQIKFGETLQEYIEQNYPIYDKLDSWLFDECLQNLLIDSNAICVLIPLAFNVKKNELIKPIPFIANSDEVLYYSENDYVVLISDKEVEVQEENFKKKYKVHILSTQNEIVEYYIKDNQKGKEYVELNRLTHNLGELQAFRFRGVFYKNIDSDIVWKSPINSMVVHLDEAAREYSDLQAEKVLHIYSEKWQINTNTCKKCNGLGKYKIGLIGDFSTCTSCNGSGFEVVSPFKSHHINVDLSKPNSQIPPIPPAGYIQKDTAITKILEESVSKHLYQALESINMQFLFEVPINESGISKQWDRDETDNFAFKIATILKYIRENVAYYTNNLRYYYIQNKEQRLKALPKVTVPQKYDLVNNQLLIEEYKQAKDAKLSPAILASMEREIALKRFSHNESVSTFTALVYSLDPLYCVSEDDKMLRLQNKGITEKDYVISSNIHMFVRRALTEDSKFAEKEYNVQLSVIEKYADEIIKANSAFNSLLISENGENIPLENGNQLAQSVGGLTGMIEIVKAVASGVYDLDAVVSLVSQRFGITEEEARKQLGTPR